MSLLVPNPSANPVGYTKGVFRLKRSIAAMLAALTMFAASTAPAFANTRYTSVRQNYTTAYSRYNQSTLSKLPPGVRSYDALVHPLADLSASSQQKFDAVLRVAKSKLGTPYIWGHNEDRGQYGFDCSNFTAYVYHHALGYVMSGASQVQNHDVGYRVSKYNMKPGDLIIFDNGGHVGIYIGNNKMIEEGGGLGRVGYLSLARNSYWYGHITAVKRMF